MSDTPPERRADDVGTALPEDALDPGMAAILCRHLPTARAALIEAHACADTGALQDAAHSLRGAVAYFNASTLRDALAQLEDAARQQDQTSVDRGLDCVCREIDRWLAAAPVAATAVTGTTHGQNQ